MCFDRVILIDVVWWIDVCIFVGEWLLLVGVFFVVKDNIDVVGIDIIVGCLSFVYVFVLLVMMVDCLVFVGVICIGKINFD